MDASTYYIQTETINSQQLMKINLTKVKQNFNSLIIVVMIQNSNPKQNAHLYMIDIQHTNLHTNIAHKFTLAEDKF